MAEIKSAMHFAPGLMTGDSSSNASVRLAAMCVDKTVSVFDYHRHEKIKTISIGHALTCVSLSSDGHEMLLNLNCNEIWSVGVDDGEVGQKYHGQKQGTFVIRSCYGGATEGFVVSGGEGRSPFHPLSLSSANSIPPDGKICIWHRHTGRLLEQLEGHHPACVNTVAWNRAKPSVFASAGDDSKVRVWAASNLNISPTEVFRSSRHPSNAVSNGEETNGHSVPRWGSAAGGDGTSRGSSLMRREV